MIRVVILSRSVTKGLPKLPRHVIDKLMDWVAGVESYGLEQMRKLPGYHDEPLKGRRAGQRSIRLSRAYRAIYQIEQDEVHLEFVQVMDVNKHDY